MVVEFDVISNKAPSWHVKIGLVNFKSVSASRWEITQENFPLLFVVHGKNFEGYDDERNRFERA
ncbi:MULTISPECIES: hypothetical protein [Photorhabdus]|uniref:Uncharacterized protein n=2 Tax=Photorhabdus TaxID=29487 RepID=A0A2S8PVG5_9GAMM|nr:MULTISPECIES: hypothetical protein [Photorhabdus]EQC00819.1 hypothetical protein B738_08819 [Photorhabdus temperata subsp. temperata M1021]ERT11040.1 hypothetical protein O185_21650 [Photorhabdus temperata J3]PQQ22897.1 hypothetical protein C6H66_21605 [Photorhabdus hindustanensis]PQQ35780.1 hypothetical protein C6H68_23185 [Photorhabdus luminescens]